jgi:hypothetical protein
MQYWKHVGPYRLPCEGKWINENIKIEGLIGASIIREAENGAPSFLVVCGQQFEATEVD